MNYFRAHNTHPFLCFLLLGRRHGAVANARGWEPLNFSQGEQIKNRTCRYRYLVAGAGSGACGSGDELFFKEKLCLIRHLREVSRHSYASSTASRELKTSHTRNIDLKAGESYCNISQCQDRLRFS
jgi:hypothetical protein